MKARWSTDLWLVAALTLLLILVITVFPSSTARVALGLPFLLFLPGYALTAALFPGRGSLGGVERVALSWGLSIALVPLIGFALNFTSWGIRLYPILFSLAVFILAACGVAWYRRRRLASEDRFAVSFKIRLPSWQGQRGLDRVLSVALVAAIAAALGTLGYAIATPRIGEQFTEFYILGPEGKAANYTTVLKVGEEGRVTVGIVNHEHEPATYRVELWMNGAKSELRVAGKYRDYLETDLAHEAKWEQEVGFVPLAAGERQKVEFVLFKNGELRFEEPLRLWIDVAEG